VNSVYICYVKCTEKYANSSNGTIYYYRDEFFDVLARIRVPKIQAFRDVKSPVIDGAHLAQRNAKVLCPRREIERDTAFYEQ